jgi:uroporphyrinogen decarboxylase
VRIKKRFGNRLALFGGLDVQHLMPRGRPKEVKREVRRLVKHCGEGGGYLLSPAHHLQADTPMKNIDAFYQAALGREDT